MHLDVARHFFPRDVVERYIDLIAFHHFNVFHWHLTDDQGFRFEVKSHPELTAVGGRDGFYSQEDMRAVVRYAADRGITVIPEIEMPGHARAILAAHPELSCTGKPQDVPRTWGTFDDVLCAGNEQTYALIEDILREVVAVFPSQLVHVGGDEAPETRWSACPKCRAAMKASNVRADELEAVFMQRIGAILTRLGRRGAVWDEALSPRWKDPVVFAWREQARGRDAAIAGRDVVMAPHDHVYFNVHQSRLPGGPGHDGFLPWNKVLAFDPVPEDLPRERRARILGAETNIR
jgi:hexosaminidase